MAPAGSRHLDAFLMSKDSLPYIWPIVFFVHTCVVETMQEVHLLIVACLEGKGRACEDIQQEAIGHLCRSGIDLLEWAQVPTTCRAPVS